MFALVLAMLMSVVLAVAVVGVVAIPARREGREMLTPKGEKVVSRVRTGATFAATRDKVADVTSPKDS